MSGSKRYVTEKTLVQGVAVPLFVFATQNVLTGNVYTGGAAYGIALALVAATHYLDIARLPLDPDTVQDLGEQAAEQAGDAARETLGTSDTNSGNETDT